MNREQVIRMATEAGILEPGKMHGRTVVVFELQKFAALVAEAEREACVQIADHCADADMHASMAANSIRARGNP